MLCIKTEFHVKFQQLHHQLLPLLQLQLPPLQPLPLPTLVSPALPLLQLPQPQLQPQQTCEVDRELQRCMQYIDI